MQTLGIMCSLGNRHIANLALAVPANCNLQPPQTHRLAFPEMIQNSYKADHPRGLRKFKMGCLCLDCFKP